MRTSKIKWTEEEVQEAVSSSKTISEALRKLGHVVAGGNYNTFHKYVKLNCIDTSHFTGKAHLIGAKRDLPKTPLEDILVEKSLYSTKHLKCRLIQDGYLENKCAECGLSSWRDKPISLHIDHINGNKFDNRLDNLRMLCPNCHSQTETYCGKNTRKNPKRYCKCGTKIQYSSYSCQVCDGLKKRDKNTKIVWPELDALVEMIKDTNAETVAKKLGVGSNAIRKRLKTRGIDPKSLNPMK